jgi:predicted aspartyl protease
MGIVHVRVAVFSVDYGRSESVDLLVDTGSTLTWIPEDLALRLGLRPSSVGRFEMADGRVLERPIADAPVECEGVRGTVRITFARPGDANVLGITALETLGFEVDPVRRALKRVDRYLALSA